MNLIDNIKRIYNSFDFRGNRIKNLRVDTPEESPNYTDPNYAEKKDFVANKEYVDKVTTYDTELAKNIQIPKETDINQSVYGKSFKELFDMILFPNNKPYFKKPKFERIILTQLNQLIPDILFIGQNIDLNLRILIDSGHYSSTELLYFNIFDNSNQEVPENKFSSGTETSNGYYSIQSKFVFNNTKSYKLTKNFNSSILLYNKQDKSSSDTDLPLTLDINLYPIFEKQFNIYNPIFYKFEGVATQPILSNILLPKINQEFIAQLSIPGDIDGIEYFITTNNDLILGNGLINTNQLIESSKSKQNIFGNIVDYTTGIFNFGTFQNNEKIYLYPASWRTRQASRITDYLLSKQ